MKGTPVTVRQLQKEDIAAFTSAAHASEKLHRPWLEAPSSIGGFRAYLKRSEAADQFAFVVVSTADHGRFAGYATVSSIVRGVLQSGYLGFAAFSGYEGRGLIKAGLRLVIDEAFGDLGLHRLEANVQPGNERSAALVSSLGFRLEGHSPRYLRIDGAWRDHDRYAITREEWPLRPDA